MMIKALVAKITFDAESYLHAVDLAGDANAVQITDFIKVETGIDIDTALTSIEVAELEQLYKR